MKIVEKLVNNYVQPDDKELKYLVWILLCELQQYTDSVEIDEKESFAIDAVIEKLELEPEFK